MHEEMRALVLIFGHNHTGNALGVHSLDREDPIFELQGLPFDGQMAQMIGDQTA